MRFPLKFCFTSGFMVIGNITSYHTGENEGTPAAVWFTKFLMDALKAMNLSITL